MIVDRETAESDVNRWLNNKNIKPVKREGKYKELIKNLVDYVCEGDIIIDNECYIIQTLSVPFENEKPLKEFKYKSRIKIEEVRVDTSINNDAFAFTYAYVAALTGLPVGLVKKMDSEDFKVAQTITGFFM